MNRAIFLDRDDTIVPDVPYNADPDRVELLPGAAEALRGMRAAGYLLVLVTNQSGIGRGKFTVRDLAAVHARLEQLLAREGVTVDRILYCPHAPGDRCQCRKPGPAMIRDAAETLDIECTHSWMIGDKESDVVAGRNAGCRTIRIAPPNTPSIAHFTAPNLPQALRIIMT